MRIDRSVLSVIQGALLHIVRNAVAHGIEAVSQRSAAGKPVEGRRHAPRVPAGQGRCPLPAPTTGEVSILTRCETWPGAEAAWTKARRWSRRHCCPCSSRAASATSGVVTGVSGRGIGLDVVREAAERLGGEVTARTHAGHGTTVELTRSAVDRRVLRAHRRSGFDGIVAIPLDAVRRTMRIRREEIVRTGQQRVRALQRTGHSGRFVATARPRRPSSPSAATRVIGRRRGGPDRRGRLQRRPDSGYARTSSCVDFQSWHRRRTIVAGVHLRRGRAIRNWCSIPIAWWRRRNRSVCPRSRLTLFRASILVVDDSLTTRMLEAEHPGVGGLHRRPGDIRRRGARQGAADAAMPCFSSTSRCQAWTGSRSSSGSARIRCSS